MSSRDSALRLLVVDDEIGFADVLCKRMLHRGIKACFAETGKKAIRLLRGNDFDVAIVDLKLEGMDGVEILKVFKLMAPDMPVLMLTGHGCENARRKCLKCGADGYLSKPVDFDTLLVTTLDAGGKGVSP